MADEIIRNILEEGAIGGAVGPQVQRLADLDMGFLDFMGNNSKLRTVDNLPIEKKVKKINKDFSAFKLTFDAGSSGKERNKTFALLKEKARALAARSKYYEATSLLEGIDVDEGTDLGTNLLMAVCYLQLGRESKANKSIKNITKSLMKNPTLPADEVIDLIDSFEDSEQYTSGLILLPVAKELYKRQSSVDDVLDGLFRCIEKANGCARPMISEGGRSRILAIDFGMDFMVETLDELKNLEGADHQKRAFKQSLAATLVAYDFWMLKENLKGVRIREDAIRAMDEAFGPQHAKQRRIYGNTLYNIGVGYDILGKHTKAKEAYEKALDAIDSATDYDDESRRQKDSKLCKQKMRELHN